MTDSEKGAPRSRHPHVVNVKNVPVMREASASGFTHSRRMLGRATCNRELGCSLVEVPPRCTAWPRHAHLANEEALYILSGHGKLRIGEAEILVGPEDYATLPANPELAHQLRNHTDEPLVYLCMSTMNSPEVVLYPDSDKVGVLAGSAPGGSSKERILTAFYPRGADVDYFTGESANEGEE